MGALARWFRRLLRLGADTEDSQSRQARLAEQARRRRQRQQSRRAGAARGGTRRGQPSPSASGASAERDEYTELVEEALRSRHAHQVTRLELSEHPAGFAEPEQALGADPAAPLEPADHIDPADLPTPPSQPTPPADAAPAVPPSADAAPADPAAPSQGRPARDEPAASPRRMRRRPPQQRDKAAKPSPQHSTGEDLQAVVLAAARLWGWRPLPVDQQCRCPEREADLLMLARDGSLLVWALAGPSDEIGTALQAWLAAVDAVPGASAGVMRPGDKDKMLAALRRRTGAASAERHDTA